jgi:glyoxylase-like metal-dependent hydrolase (beta-lactamase superfamily II)
MLTEGNAVWLADGIGMVDLKFRGEDNLIAAYILTTSDGLLVIETGPANTADRLLAGVRALGLDPMDIRQIAVTHIHLDHAAAAGELLEQLPDAVLHVHKVGARHMIDPSRLLDSAGRIYGSQMEALWGVMKPVPAERVRQIDDGDTITCGDVSLDVLYTPGHASHHVSYVLRDRSKIFTGDVAGVRIPPSSIAWPPTPPPDIDAEAWHGSVQRLRELEPAQLLLTHFGPIDDVSEHLDQLDRRIDRWVRLFESMVADGLTRDEMAERLADDAQHEMTAAGEVDDVQGAVSNVTPFGMATDGMLRYLSKRDSRA